MTFEAQPTPKFLMVFSAIFFFALFFWGLVIIGWLCAAIAKGMLNV